MTGEEEINQSVLDSLQWEQISMDNAADILNDRYREAKKWRKRAQEMILEVGNEYHGPSLEQHCYMTGKDIFGAIPEVKKCMKTHRYLRIGDVYFFRAKVDSANSHVLYRIIEFKQQFQLSLF
ncbi:hypothetical protein [Flavobacterium sp. 25HG05S-40]|uniref:hypothetical protein n=1 Tax=Flavobacterium sp. 25HG05S-40 TaxID=3458682 RepID=UPI00404504B8